jgi:hypothetical protein
VEKEWDKLDTRLAKYDQNSEQTLLLKLPGGHVRPWTGYIQYSSWICPAYPEIFFSTLILELQGTKMDETWTLGSPQHKEQVSNEVFPKSKYFFLILDELEEPRFWENWEKSTKLKGLEPWIYFKIGGR